MVRFKTRCAVFLILTKEEKGEKYVLLQHRYNTGIEDDKWGVSVGGHLEKGETIKSCLIRETLEEINITLDPNELTLVNIVHANFNGSEYIMPVFHSSNWQGNPKIMEPDKCDDLKWFNIHNLPENMSANRRQMIEDYLNNQNYREIGFE